MKRFHLLCMLGMMVSPALAPGQGATLPAPALTVSNEHPNPGQAVVIEVNVTPNKDTRISWSKSGDGDFTSPIENRQSVTFVPTTPGGTVIIVCNVSMPGSHAKPAAEFTVLGTPAPPQHPVHQNDRHPTEVHHTEDARIPEMDYMVLSGYMGDAAPENFVDRKVRAAVVDEGNNQGCHPGSDSCLKIDYNPANGTAGWAAFAYQRVTTGKMNWGESPGADLTGRGFHSVRVYARGIPVDGGPLPRAQFKSGGNVAPDYKNNQASYVASGPVVTLHADFQEYCISLEDKNLSNVVSPFTVVLPAAGDRAVEAILDGIRFSTQPCN